MRMSDILPLQKGRNFRLKFLRSLLPHIVFDQELHRQPLIGHIAKIATWGTGISKLKHLHHIGNPIRIYRYIWRHQKRSNSIGGCRMI